MSLPSLVDIGQDALLKGQFEKALWALDAALYLADSSDSSCSPAPSLWQRGLACYYMGLYQEGQRQFECDVSDSERDAEAVVWHFMCRSAALGDNQGKEFSAENVLSLHTGTSPSPSSPSSFSFELVPPPMLEVVNLFKGTGSVEAVLKSATSPDGAAKVISYNHTNALAYAHFYIGLHYEILGELKKAREHLKAATELKNPDFMGKLMGTHFELFCLRFLPVVHLSGPRQSRLIQGGWQLSRGHLIGGEQNQGGLVRSLLRAVDAVVRSFDCGDIYTGVEELYGKMLKAHCLRGGRRGDIRIHTKFVPDLDIIRTRSVNRSYVESVIRRSLNRLGVSTVDLVQFHWWDSSVPGCLAALQVLSDLAREGLVHEVGITNFDTESTRSFVEAGIRLASTQVRKLG